MNAQRLTLTYELTIVLLLCFTLFKISTNVRNLVSHTERTLSSFIIRVRSSAVKTLTNNSHLNKALRFSQERDFSLLNFNLKLWSRYIKKQIFKFHMRSIEKVRNSLEVNKNGRKSQQQ